MATDLTRPAQACQDTPLLRQGRSEPLQMILPILFMYIT